MIDAGEMRPESEMMKALLDAANARIADLLAQHSARVTELLEANNHEVERRRMAERRVAAIEATARQPMTDTRDPQDIAYSIARCTCQPRPPNRHYSNCPIELADEIRDAILSERHVAELWREEWRQSSERAGRYKAALVVARNALIKIGQQEGHAPTIAFDALTNDVALAVLNDLLPKPAGEGDA